MNTSINPDEAAARLKKAASKGGIDAMFGIMTSDIATVLADRERLKAARGTTQKLLDKMDDERSQLRAEVADLKAQIREITTGEKTP